MKWKLAAAALAFCASSVALANQVNYEDPNMSRRHDYVSDAASACATQNVNQRTLETCLKEQGLDKDEVSQALFIMRATNPHVGLKVAETPNAAFTNRVPSSQPARPRRATK